MAVNQLETTVPYFPMVIDGEEVDALTSRRYDTVDPATGEVWAQIAAGNVDDVDRAVRAATRAFQRWGSLAASERGRMLRGFAEGLAVAAEEIAAAETRENGKLAAESLGQMRATPEWLYYYAGLADKIQGATLPLQDPTSFAYTRREPIGVVAVISPWNSPTWLSVVSAAPALAAGNTVVIKPSEHASAGVLILARVATEAGLPPGVINVVTGGPETGAALVEHQGVGKIAFTGGSAAGAQVAAVAGRRLIPCTTELGGKSPNVVFADADIERAVAGIASGIFGSVGQACTAGSRLLAHNSVFDEVVTAVADAGTRLRIGRPTDPDTQLGPIANEPHLGKVEGMVASAVTDGAEVVAGGGRASVQGSEGGFYFQPTVLAGLSSDAAIVRNEVFGPVLAVLPFSEEEEAVRLANDSAYGLAAGIWTQNLDRAHRVSAAIQAGIVWINTFKAITYTTPLGGFKQSGVGRVHGLDAVDGFLQTKTVWCNIAKA